MIGFGGAMVLKGFNTEVINMDCTFLNNSGKAFSLAGLRLMQGKWLGKIGLSPCNLQNECLYKYRCINQMPCHALLFED